MKLFIDGSNLRQGGGVTHLQEVLAAAKHKNYGFETIVVLVPTSTKARITEMDTVKCTTHPEVDRGGWRTEWFRRAHLSAMLEGCDLLWVPGGTYSGGFTPYVTMVRNFLPFDIPERNRFKYSKTWLRYVILKHLQLKSFKRAAGLIHISEKTQEVISDYAELPGVQQTVIHHGLNERFLHAPRPARAFSKFTPETPARLLYISPINLYKHQDVLVKAVYKLRQKGIPIQLDLVGPVFQPAGSRLDVVLEELDPQREWVTVHGKVPYAEVTDYYRNADLYVCLSSCETFGMILLEAMGAGLPILCSNKSALPEIHAGACPEVEPEDVDAVEIGIENLLRSPEQRGQIAQQAYERAKEFSWQTTAERTFAFLREVALNANPSLEQDVI
ncbi:glycosyltransferase family 1 protein [Kiritimatiellaeota bacterium B1221]|nr:glycosyltransferase family 1 protein [Kiritimatiellaeota bacterium B1221]